MNEGGISRTGDICDILFTALFPIAMLSWLVCGR